jgi:hypothetical protein
MFSGRGPPRKRICKKARIPGQTRLSFGSKSVVSKARDGEQEKGIDDYE